MDKKRIIVITGGSSGIGKELMAAFSSSGDKCYSLSRSGEGDNHITCDVGIESDVIAAMETIGQREGRIDILVNNAGVGISGATELLESDRVRTVMDVNFMGTFFCCKHALPLMERGGKIINISSVTAFFATPFRVIYCAAKAAVNMLSYGLRMELREAGIAVTAVCPAETKTNFTKNRIKEFQTNERYGDRIKNAAEGIDKKDGSRMPAALVAAKIYRIANKRRFRPHYIVGGKFKIFKKLQRAVPTGMMLGVIDRLFGGYKKSGK